jgi:hypothetical protein
MRATSRTWLLAASAAHRASSLIWRLLGVGILLCPASFVFAATDQDAVLPTLTVEAMAPVFDLNKGVWLRVRLDNGQTGCRPVLITDTFFSSPENRPQTLLEFDMRDEAGHFVPRLGQTGFTRPRYMVGDLVTLHCGAFYGWYVVMGRVEWMYALRPGKYRLRARVENRLRSYFSGAPKELERLSVTRGLSSELMMEQLRDFSVSSEEITIEIGK